MYRHGFDGVVKAFARRECRVVVAWRWKIHAFVGRARAAAARAVSSSDTSTEP
jgi:hypothetical protein